MTSSSYLAAELARQVRQIDLDYYHRRTTYVIFELRKRGLWDLIEREGLALAVKRELYTVEVRDAAERLSA